MLLIMFHDSTLWLGTEGTFDEGWAGAQSSACWAWLGA